MQNVPHIIVMWLFQFTQEETIETPHIDKVLQQYRNHLGRKGSVSKTNEQKRGVSVSLYPSNSEYDVRLGALERQLTELMQKNEVRK